MRFFLVLKHKLQRGVLGIFKNSSRFLVKYVNCYMVDRKYK